jgi:putative transposase
MDASLMARMEELEQENARLKKMYADVQLQYEVVRESLAKNGKAVSVS